MNATPVNARRSARRTLIPALTLIGALGLTTDAAALPCVEDKFGGNVNCTANDISITEIADVVVTDNGCTSQDDTVTFNATLTVVTTATARYDIGLFVSEDGLSAQTGECEVFALPNSPTPPYSNLDNDTCGDSVSSVTLEVPVTSVTVDCTDTNGDNELDIVSCTTWQQNSGDVCTGAADVTAGTASKCNCPTTPTDIPIFVPDPICITNADCEELATGCNVGVCDSANPDADAFGCLFTPDDTQCDDGDFCNGEETCDATLGCQAGTPPNCDDGVTCTTDACNESTDECTNTPDNGLCNDDEFCNGVETCDETLGCQAGTPPNCNDGVTCTTDACNEASDACTNTPDDVVCYDGEFCNGAESCDETLGCQAGTPPNCNDGVACTTDACNEASDACTNTPNNALCNDGEFCNGVETCDEENGCEAGTPPNCNDSVACTTDACNEATDACTNTPNNALCNDGEFCNGVETCDEENGCEAGTAPNCNDGVACTTDACNEATDACTNTPANGLCNDGEFCNGVETCDESGCLPGTAPNCNDGVTCTVDACNESIDACTNTPDNALCNDGEFCNGVETCDEENDCEAGTAPNCNDGVACTTDACNETTDACTNTPNNALCNDGEFCNGVETCDEENGCEAGTPPNCNDGVACTTDACNEATDACTSTANNTLCNDGEMCNGVEICNPDLGCQNGSAMNCDDNDACTLDMCVEEEGGCQQQDICEENGICRSPGFWSTHGGSEKGGPNLTQEVLDAAGGIEVCGETITETDDLGSLDSALEGLCVSTNGVKQRALYRQLVAAALNCAISNSNDCDATIDGLVEISFDECSALCAGDDVGGEPTVTQCIRHLDCYNNGGEVINGTCAFGNCSITNELCGGGAGECDPVNEVSQTCVEFPDNCHDAEFCNEDIGICPDSTGPASSSRACREARKNACTIESCN
jgi:hypothetical protein